MEVVVERNLQIARCFCFEDNSNIMEASFICAPQSCPDHDVTLLWRQGKESSGYVDENEYQGGDDDSMKVGEDDRVLVHMAAIEIKDDR